MDDRLASDLWRSFDAAATNQLPLAKKSELERLTVSCRRDVAPFFARGSGRSQDGARLAEGALPDSDRMAFNLKAYCSYKALNSVISGKVDRMAFRSQLGRLGLDKMAEGSPGLRSRLEEKDPSLTRVIDDVKFLLDELVRERFIARWSLQGDSSSFPDAVDDEYFAKNRNARFEILMDDEPSMQGAILLQEEGTRFFPQFVGSMLQTLLRTVLNSEVTVMWEEYYMDPRRSADPDLFEPRQILMEWRIGE